MSGNSFHNKTSAILVFIFIGFGLLSALNHAIGPAGLAILSVLLYRYWLYWSRKRQNIGKLASADKEHQREIGNSRPGI